PLFKHGTNTFVRKTLKEIFGVEITREYVGKVIKKIAQEDHLYKFRGRRKVSLDVYWPSEKLYKLTEPVKMFRVKKWKRNGHQRPETPRNLKDDKAFRGER
ncbi:unnamed protein product, partial [marine sediment metagenome]